MSLRSPNTLKWFATTGEQSLCLAFPGTVLTINEDVAKIDFGGGTVRDGINIAMVRPRVGDLVLVHAGYAVQILDATEAERAIRYWEANIMWKCDRCSLLHDCPQGGIYLEKRSRGGLLVLQRGIRLGGDGLR